MACALLGLDEEALREDRGTLGQVAVGKRFSCGVVLYGGEASVGFGEGLYAVPIRALWELTR